MADFTSPLQLSDFQIQKYHFEVADDHEPDLTCEQSAELDFDLRFKDEAQDACLLILKHAINLSDADFERCGIRIQATVGGFFNLSALKEQYPDEGERMGFLLVNGLSMLYTMLRQVVAQTAAQSSLTRVMLPTVNMGEFLRRYAEEQAARGVEAPTEPQ
ncbi:MAG: hypothetical protein ACYCXZ_01010 [Coriobacteriia bacterium]